MHVKLFTIDELTLVLSRVLKVFIVPNLNLADKAHRKKLQFSRIRSFRVKFQHEF